VTLPISQDTNSWEIVLLRGLGFGAFAASGEADRTNSNLGHDVPASLPGGHTLPTCRVATSPSRPADHRRSRPFEVDSNSNDPLTVYHEAHVPILRNPDLSRFAESRTALVIGQGDPAIAVSRDDALRR
jgi:hypothetical protein